MPQRLTPSVLAKARFRILRSFSESTAETMCYVREDRGIKPPTPVSFRILVTESRREIQEPEVCRDSMQKTPCFDLDAHVRGMGCRECGFHLLFRKLSGQKVIFTLSKGNHF